MSRAAESRAPSPAQADAPVIALMGNPNVGKSTLFNRLTHLRQHTGNWPGKTVESASGVFTYKGRPYRVVDLPGTYSVLGKSPEEQVAVDYIRSGEAQVVVVVCDGTCLERNLNLALQVMRLTSRVVVCVNLLDEAEKKHIRIDLRRLESLLGVPVVGTAAGSGDGIGALQEALRLVVDGFSEPRPAVFAREGGQTPEELVRAAERLAAQVQEGGRGVREGRLERLLTGRWTAFPVMLLLLLTVFWLTIVGANVPSALLQRGFDRVGAWLRAAFSLLRAPWWLRGALLDGVWETVARVVAVMLPPMAIFFPLFTLLEDLGYLPRVAYALDRPFAVCGACGKQSLSMCMGFGCNAAGVVGCRIIDSPRERLIAVLTNSFVPCNGRFPALITLILLLTGGRGGGLVSASALTACVLLGIAMTFLASRLLSRTVLRGVPSSFTLELPPFRRPRVAEVIVRSMLDRTLFVLGRAAAVAAPAGLAIWCMRSVSVGGTSLMTAAAAFLQPAGAALGLSGTILLAFLLGFPANELVIPIILMMTSGGGIGTESGMADTVRTLLGAGWNARTAVCCILFFLFHWPCSTTCLTIRRETGSTVWTLAAAALPTAFGILLCAAVRLIWRG